MQGNQQDMEVLGGWCAFVEATGLAKSRVSAADIQQEQQIRFSRHTVQEDLTGFSFSLSPHQSADLKQRFVKTGDQGEASSEPLHLGFPLLRIVEKKKTWFVPLFRFPLHDHWYHEQQLDVSVPVKQGADVTADIAAFREYLDIDIQELGAERHMMSIAAACMGVQRENFIELFQAFLNWILQRLTDLDATRQTGSSVSLEKTFTALVCPLVNSDFNSKEQLKDYKWLLNRPGLHTAPLLQQYIELRCDHSSSRSIGFTRFPFGLFERKYPLGRGQMETLVQVASGESLVAVQGAPGTGKTTLFKSLIASQIVERALACIAGEDRNLGLVVTSTAKKAVDNVIDDLRKDPHLKGFNWLYFLGGDKAQVATEVERVATLLDELKTHVYDVQRQQLLATQIIEIRQLINQCFTSFEQCQHAVHTAWLALADDAPHTFVERLEAQERDVLAKAVELALLAEHEHPGLNVVLARCAEAQKDLLKQSNHYTNAKERLERRYGKLIDAPFTDMAYHGWLGSKLSETLEHHFVDYPHGMFAGLLGWLARAKYSRALEHLKRTCAEEFAEYRLEGLGHARLAELARDRKALLAAPDGKTQLEIVARGAPDNAQEQALTALCAAIEGLLERQSAWRRYETACRDLSAEFPEGDWIEVLRLRFIGQQRALFEHALDYLWQELLRQKTLLAEVLPLWCNLLSGQKDGGFYKWKDQHTEFYRLVTMAYPLMASTLASVQKLAGYKLADLNGHTPYQISLVDEAGMISAESLVPLLARSQRAIVVGDPLQIEPIRTLDSAMAKALKDKYFPDNTLYEAVSPMLVTAYHRAAGSRTGAITDAGNGIVLDEHRRSQPAIAKLFMEIAGYAGVKICTDAPEPRIQVACEHMGGFNLMFYGVEGSRGLMPNTNQDEVDAIGLLLDKLEAAGYDLTCDVGIITPYANQKTLLIKAYGERMNQRQALKIGSVHQFQGVGFEVIIFSPVIFQRSDKDNFQNAKPNLLNVAVSRAKQQFIVVGNQQRLLSAGGSLAKLAGMCSASFYVGMERQSPSYPGVASSGVKHYVDCEHISAFEALLAASQRSFTAVVPWIRQGTNSNHPPLRLLRAAQARGIAVTIYYGYHREGYVNADDGDPNLILAYRRELGAANVIRVPEGTHEKILLVDDQVATIGSWNWLSHSYYRYCEVPTAKPLALRRETTVELRDPQLIHQLKERIGCA